MVHLNHFHKLLFVILCTLELRAEVMRFFDPLKPHTHDTLSLTTSYFIANDAISLEEFFGDWEKHFHPKSGKNLALQDMRVDVGGIFYHDIYVGYFYRYNIAIKADETFAELYYSAKNKLDFTENKVYTLGLDIEGIEENGLLFSQRKTLYEDEKHRLSFGGALSLSYGFHMQDGFIRGQADTPSQKVYHIDADVSSYYTHNYLYDLEVDASRGWGVGSHAGFSYENKLYDYAFTLLINDLYSRMYWKDLPYSLVDLQSENRRFDENGYVEYDPSISGLEIYKDFTQKIAPRYNVDFQKSIYKDTAIAVGVTRIYKENFPYIRLDSTLTHDAEVNMQYESRFKSFGFGYRYKAFSFGLSTDGLSHFSALGLRAGINHRF